MQNVNNESEDEKVKADIEVSNMVDNINRDCNYAFKECD